MSSFDSTLSKRIEFNFWANRRIAEAVRSIPEHSGSEALSLLAHLVTAERVWLDRVAGEEPPGELWPELSLQECEEIFRDSYERLLKLSESDLGRKVNYENSSGASFTQPLSDILFHLLTHSVYHRGQINREIRASGGEPAVAGYIYYCRGLQESG